MTGFLYARCRHCGARIVTVSRAFGHYGAARNGWMHEEQPPVTGPAGRHPASPKASTVRGRRS